MQLQLNVELEVWQMTPLDWMYSREKLFPFGGNFSHNSFDEAVKFATHWGDEGAALLDETVRSLVTVHAVEVLKAMQSNQSIPQAVVDCYKSPTEVLTALQQSVAPDALQPSARASLPASGRG